MVATPYADLTRYEPIYVALATPAGEGVALRVARLTGRPAYAGFGRFDGDGIVFDLLAAELPGLSAVTATLTLGYGVLRVAGRSVRRCAPGTAPAEAGFYEVP